MSKIDIAVDLDAKASDAGIAAVPQRSSAVVTPSPQGVLLSATNAFAGAPRSLNAQDTFLSPPPKPPTCTADAVSPSNLIGFDEATSRLNLDKIMEQPFYRNACMEKIEMLHQCLLFLYGREFYWDAPTETRVHIICNLFETDETTRRLHQIASMTGDIDKSDDDGMKEKFKLFVTSFWRLLEMERENGFVGFVPNMADLHLYLRLQTWGNCYLVSSCTAFGYQLQKNFPGVVCGTPDASQFARRTMNDLGLYNLVTEKVGGNSATEFLRLAHIPVDQYHNAFTILKFKENNCDSGEAFVHGLIGRKGVGLVNGFEIHPSFEKCGNSHVDAFGRPIVRSHEIPLFDGDINAEPQFKQLPRASADEEDKFEQLWEALQARPPKKLNATAPFYRLPTDVEGAQVPPASPQLSGTRPSTPRANFRAEIPVLTPPEPQYLRQGEVRPKLVTHSLVMLCAYRDPGDNGKRFFLMQNSWEWMPLVLMSAQYLAACGATVCFPDHKIGKAPAFERSSLPVTSCAMPLSYEQLPPRGPPPPLGPPSSYPPTVP